MEGNLSSIVAENWEAIGAGLVAIAAGIGAFFIKNPTFFRGATSTDNRPEVDLSPVRSQIEDIDRRVTEVVRDQTSMRSDIKDLKTELRHMPSAQDLHDLELKVSSLKGQISGVENLMKSVGASVQRMEGFMLQIGTKDKS